MYQIESASNRIKRELRRILPPDRVRIAEAVQALAEDPRPPGVVQLEQDVYRLRVGDYRVIYKVLDEEQIVLIGRIIRHSTMLMAGVRKARITKGASWPEEIPFEPVPIKGPPLSQTIIEERKGRTKPFQLTTLRGLIGVNE